MSTIKVSELTEKTTTSGEEEILINDGGTSKKITVSNLYTVGDGGLTDNNFTNDDHSKLDDIESLADVTDSDNVVAALTSGTNIAIAADGTISSSTSGSDEVPNDSSVTGTTTSDALDTLYGYIFPPALSGLNDSISYINEISVSLYQNILITWSQSGGVSGQVLTTIGNEHTDGDLDVTLTDSATSYTATGKTFSRSTRGNIYWYVKSNNNTVSTTTSSLWVLASYVGKNTTGNTPTVTEIEAGTKYILDNRYNITRNPNTSSSEYGWFAVDKNVSQHTTWYIDALNNGSISSSGFIKNAGIVGDYRVYIYNYASAVNNDIKLD